MPKKVLESCCICAVLMVFYKQQRQFWKICTKIKDFQKRKGEVSMLILGNGRMITRDADNPYLECGAVVIDGTKIVKAGTLSEVKAAYLDA